MGNSIEYREGQRWSIQNEVPGFEPTLVIGEVEGPPHSSVPRNIVYVRYQKKPGVWVPTDVEGVCLILDHQAFERSVKQLIESDVKLPEWWRYGQEHDLPHRPRAMANLICDKLSTGLQHLLEKERERNKGRRASAKAISRKELLRRLAPWRAAHKRTAWKPTTRASDRDVTASKFGGTPWLGEGENLPCCKTCQNPMPLLLQLNLAQLPQELAGKFGHGLLQLFYCVAAPANCDEEDACEPFAGSKVVRIVQPDTASRPSKSLDKEVLFPAKTIVNWKPVEDLPNSQEHRDLGLDYDFDFARQTVTVICADPEEQFENQKDDAPEAIASALPGDKLAGWPRWIQAAQYPRCQLCRQPMQLVFQLDSEDHVPYSFGDLGCGHITQCAEHQHIVTFSWSCS